MRRRAGLCLAAAVAGALAGCTVAPDPSSSPSVPRITVGGSSDVQTSLAPGQVLAARRAAGIADCPVATQVPAARPADGLPDLALPCLGGGQTVNLAALPTGRPYVVNVWAQWCWPCTQEAPYLGEVWKQARGRVGFLGINYQDPSPGKAIDFARHHGLGYPELSDPRGSARGPLRVAAIPQTLFVDARGHVVHRETEPFTSADQLRHLIREHLGVEL